MISLNEIQSAGKKKKKKSTIIQENDIISVLALFTICLAQHLTEFPINI